MAQRRGGSGFSQKSLSGDLAVQKGAVDDLQCDGAPEIGVESLVGDAHGTSSQFPKTSIISAENFVMLIALSVCHGFLQLIKRHQISKPLKGVRSQEGQADGLIPACRSITRSPGSLLLAP